MLNSKGDILRNKICENLISGFMSEGTSFINFKGNKIKGSQVGVVIKDPSEVQLAFNVIKQNTIQVEMDKKAAKKQWAAIQKDNPKISG